MAGLSSLAEIAIGELPLLTLPPVPTPVPQPTPVLPRDNPLEGVGIEMREIELLLPRVMERAPQCPEPTAIRHIRDAAIEFCRRTRVWRDSDTFDVASPCEPLVFNESTQIYEISTARYFGPDEVPGIDPGQRLDPVMLAWLDEQIPDWQVAEGDPCYITQGSPNSIIIRVRARPRQPEAAPWWPKIVGPWTSGAVTACLAPIVPETEMNLIRGLALPA